MMPQHQRTQTSVLLLRTHLLAITFQNKNIFDARLPSVAKSELKLKRAIPNVKEKKILCVCHFRIPQMRNSFLAKARMSVCMGRCHRQEDAWVLGPPPEHFAQLSRQFLHSLYWVSFRKKRFISWHSPRDSDNF